MKRKARRYTRAYWLVGLIACVGFAPVGASPTEAAGQSAVEDHPVILFLGTSITAGYGLPSTEAFPALIQSRVEEAGLSYRVVNAGVSGDTSAGGLRRIDWLLRMPVAILVLELGANDMLRGLEAAALQANLQAILDRTRSAYPSSRFVIAGMRAAPNLGVSYGESFEAVYPALASANDALLIPFLLEDVAGIPGLNQVDGIHPTQAGHRVIADRVWKALEPLLTPSE